MSKFRDVMGCISDLLEKVDREKQAEANTEPGGYQGGTTHPSKDVDDKTDDAQTGSRFSENTSDVKEDQGAAGVDSTPEGAAAGDNQTDIGMTSKPTGEDPAAEDDYKDGKDDPGSSHPARTDNDSLDGNKYSSLKAEFSRLCKLAEEAGKQFLAAAAANNGSAPVDKRAATPAAPAATDKAANYDLAGIFAGTDLSADDQKKASLAVIDVLHDVLDTADRRAIKVANFYRQLARESQKRAEDESAAHEQSESPAEEKTEESAPGGDDDGSGAPPPAGGGGGDDAILQLLQGGDAMGVGGGGGDDPAAAMGLGGGGDVGGDPMGGGGGAPSMSIEEILPLLLQQLQVSPDALQDKVAAYLAKQIMEPKQAASKTKRPKTAADIRLMKQVAAALQEIVSAR